MKIRQKIILFLLFLSVFCITFTTSNDFSQDLGRHLKLGEIIFQTHNVPKTNLFSYTNPTFPFINHHWGAEVIFFILVKYFGLSSLIFLKVLLMMFTFWFIYKSTEKKNAILTLSFVSIIFLPLLLDRLDIRPELFSYVFFSLLLYILFFQPNKKLLYIIPFIMFFWVNTHIAFIFGLFLICIYFLSHLKKLQRSVTFPLLLSILILFINPNGISAVTYPFNIFKNYGYTIVENQNIFFLNSATFNPVIKYFFIIIPLVLTSLFILFTKKKFSFFLILFVFFLLPFWQIRHLPFFVLVAIPIVGASVQFVLVRQFNKKITNILYAVSIFLLIGFVIFFSSNIYYQIFDKDKTFGLGFDENQKQATDFMLNKKLPGKIFNNFDIGGYAIYRLYPTYKVFVDNRPEGYPTSFFQQAYILLQEDPALREKIFHQYSIHTVLFSHTDMTPWGINFLTNILHDTNWKLVFLNKSIVIFTDKGNLPDIRSNKSKISNLVINEENYISLIQLASVFSLMDNKEDSLKAFKKAQTINPNSCAMKRFLYTQTQSNPAYFLQDDIKRSSWWCF